MSELLQGKFMAAATSYDFGTSSKGTPGCAVLFEITTGEHAGKTVPWSSWFSDATAARTIESLQHMGWKGDDPQAVVVSDLPNEVEIVVEIETFTTDQGREIDTSKVKWVNKAGGVKLAAMGAGDAQSFREKMKGLVLASRAKRPAEAAQQESFDAPQKQTGTGSKRAF